MTKILGINILGPNGWLDANDRVVKQFFKTRNSAGDQTAILEKMFSVFMILVTIAALYFIREVFVPLALALLFSFLLTPLVIRLERLKFPRIAAVLVSVTLALAALGGIGFLMGGQLMDLAYKLPAYEKNLSLRIRSLKTSDSSPLSRAGKTLDKLGKELAGTVPSLNTPKGNSESASNKQVGPPSNANDQTDEAPQKVQIVESEPSIMRFAEGALGPVFGPLGTGAIVLVFVLFMLIKREDLRDRMIHLVGRGQLIATTEAMDEAASKVTRYLMMQVAVNAVFGVLVGVGLYFIGVPHSFVWGLLASLLRFIPYLGAWIALVFPLVLSLAATNTWTMPVLTIVLFAVIELVTGNALEPWLYGSHTGLSPVAIMAATIFWTWLWGGVGLLLAMPLTVCVAVLGKYVPALAFLDALLGDEPVLAPEERYYQRLLAQDGREASAIATEYLKTHTVEELYSQVFVPALAAVEIEERKGTVDEKRQRFIFETTRELVEEFGSDLFQAKREKAAGNDKKEDGEPASAERKIASSDSLQARETIFCLPAADAADEIVAVMLAQLLEQEGFKAESVSFRTLANEVVEQIREAGSQTVCISATPPHDTLHTRYLCKVLHSKFPKLNIVVGLWESEGSEEKLAQRQARLTADKVVTTLNAAMSQLRPFAALDAKAVEIKTVDEPAENRAVSEQQAALHV